MGYQLEKMGLLCIDVLAKPLKTISLVINMDTETQWQQLG